MILHPAKAAVSLFYYVRIGAEPTKIKANSIRTRPMPSACRTNSMQWSNLQEERTVSLSTITFPGCRPEMKSELIDYFCGKKPVCQGNLEDALEEAKRNVLMYFVPTLGVGLVENITQTMEMLQTQLPNIPFNE
jgi:hypothetical protein